MAVNYTMEIKSKYCYWTVHLARASLYSIRDKPDWWGLKVGHYSFDIVFRHLELTILGEYEVRKLEDRQRAPSHMQILLAEHWQLRESVTGHYQDCCDPSS